MPSAGWSATSTTRSAMIELGEAEKDQRVITEAEAALKRLKAEAARRELEALLSGEADANDAYLEVHAGAGGTESQDWAGMLLRMYTRWAEQHGYKVELLEEIAGRGGRHQVGDHPGQGPQRLWLAEDRRRRAPAGAHLAVRFQRAAAHLVRQRRGVYPVVDDRIKIEINEVRRAHRHHALAGRRRPARQQDRIRRCASPTSRPASPWSASRSARSTRTAPGLGHAARAALRASS